MEGRTWEDYEMVDSMKTGREEIVLGVHRTQESRFATWEKSGGEYLWAHYFDSGEAALKDMGERAGRGTSRGESYALYAVVQNGNHSATIEFPSWELPDVLGSIGIRERPDAVCLGGAYDIRMLPAEGKMAEALKAVFKAGDSLQMVDDVARAVYHADFRVYYAVEEKLKHGEYHSAEEVLADAVQRAEQVRKQEERSKNRGR